MIFNTLLHLLLSYIIICLPYYLQFFSYTFTYMIYCFYIFIE